MAPVLYPSIPLLVEDLPVCQISDPVRSPLNYIGGKYKLLPQILKYFPDDIRVFVDLFCGGCNVGINIDASEVVFNDNLVYLIDLYQTLKDNDIDDVLEHIEGRIEQFNLSQTNADGYIRLRELYNTFRNPLDLFVLVAYSFNHQIRFNNSHQFNNPFGKDRSYFNGSMRRNLIYFVERLHDIDCRFCNCNFNEFDTSMLTEEDFVYCDPPYLITTGTYNDGKRGFTGWNEKEELELLKMLDGLNRRNIRFALSNVLTHKGMENYILKEWIDRNSLNVKHLEKNYSNSNYHKFDRSVNSTDEVLIINYGI